MLLKPGEWVSRVSRVSSMSGSCPAGDLCVGSV